MTRSRNFITLSRNFIVFLKYASRFIIFFFFFRGKFRRAIRKFDPYIFSTSFYFSFEEFQINHSGIINIETSCSEFKLFELKRGSLKRFALKGRGASHVLVFKVKESLIVGYKIR